MPYRIYSLLEPKPNKVVAFEAAHPGLMKVVEPIAKTIDEFLEKDVGLDLDGVETYAHPQEDFLLYSQKYPIFAVADGVTLEFSPDGTYPNPSPAGDVARIACEKIIEFLETHFNEFSESHITEAFRAANHAIGEYNTSQDRTKEKSNFWDQDLFAATVAFAVMKDGQCFWASLCDAYVEHIDESGNVLFTSPQCWPKERQLLPEDWNTRDEAERKKEIRRCYRNGIDEKGNLTGYGVLTGEAPAEYYMNKGVRSVRKGEMIGVYTDGFEEYMKLPEFLNLFVQWPENLDEKVRSFTREKSKSIPHRFGHERSIIMVRMEE